MAEVATVSVVVPVLNEAPLLSAFLRHLSETAPDSEIIVVDGGSTDGSGEIAERAISPGRGMVLRAPRGRARQMNRGAAAATGEILWFLHADSCLPPEPLAQIREALADPSVAGGCFRLHIDRSEPIYRVSDSLGNLGVDLFRIALGDHGIFCRRRAFEAASGYPEVALLEDAELYRCLQAQGKVRQLQAAIRTSARRYLKHGPLRTTLLYALILALYAARAPMPLLERIYRRLG